MENLKTLTVWNPLVYLSRSDLSRLDKQLESTLQNSTSLVFWTGISPLLAQQWAKKCGLKTLVGAMGPLYDRYSPESARHGKSLKAWSSYMKGASGRFAEYACRGRRAIVLTNAPPNIYSARMWSNFRNLEEPILKGMFGGPKAIRIDYVHPTRGGITIHYQVWSSEAPSGLVISFEGALRKTSGDELVQCTIMSDGETIESATEQRKTANVESNSHKKGKVKRTEEEEVQHKARKKKKKKKKKKAKKKTHKETQEKKAQEKKRQEKKEAKRRKMEEQQRKAKERKEAKRRKMEEQQRKAKERKEAKRRKMEEQQRKAKEKKEAKRRKIAKAQKEAQEKKRQEEREANRRKMEEEQRKAKEKKEAKLLKKEKEQKKVQEKKAAERQRKEEERRKVLDNKGAKRLK